MTVLGLFHMQLQPDPARSSCTGESVRQSPSNLGLFVVMWNYLGWDGLSTDRRRDEGPPAGLPDLHARRRGSPGGARPLLADDDRAAARLGRHRRPRHAAEAPRDARLPRRVDPRRRGRAPGARARRLPDRQHQGGPGRRLRRPRSRCTTSAAPARSRSGAAACSSRGSAASRTCTCRRCPGSRCRATPPRASATSRRTSSTRPSSSRRRARSRCRRARASATRSSGRGSSAPAIARDLAAAVSGARIIGAAGLRLGGRGRGRGCVRLRAARGAQGLRAASRPVRRPACACPRSPAASTTSRPSAASWSSSTSGLPGARPASRRCRRSSGSSARSPPRASSVVAVSTDVDQAALAALRGRARPDAAACCTTPAGAWPRERLPDHRLPRDLRDRPRRAHRCSTWWAPPSGTRPSGSLASAACWARRARGCPSLGRALAALAAQQREHRAHQVEAARDHDLVRGPCARARRRARRSARATLGSRWAPRARRPARRASAAGEAARETRGVVSTMPLASGKSARARPRTSLSAIAAKTSTNGGPPARWAASARAPAGLWAPSSRRAGSPGIRCRRPGQRVPATARGHARQIDREPGALRLLEQPDRHQQVVALVGARQRREVAVAGRGRLDRDARAAARRRRARPMRAPRCGLDHARPERACLRPDHAPRARPRAARSPSAAPRAARRPSRARSRRACGRGTPRGRSPR